MPEPLPEFMENAPLDDDSLELLRGELHHTPSRAWDRRFLATIDALQRTVSRLETAPGIDKKLFTTVCGERDEAFKRNAELEEKLQNKAADKMPHSFVKMTWACGHEGGAACVECYRAANKRIADQHEEIENPKVMLDDYKFLLKQCNEKIGELEAIIKISGEHDRFMVQQRNETIRELEEKLKKCEESNESWQSSQWTYHRCRGLKTILRYPAVLCSMCPPTKEAAESDFDPLKYIAELEAERDRLKSELEKLENDFEEYCQ